MADFGLKQMIEKPTRVTETSETLIDVILTNSPTNIKRTEVIPTSISDHYMVGCVRKLNHSDFKARNIICRDYKNYRPGDMNKDLEAIDWSPFYICQNVNEAWSLMKNVLVKIFEHHAPKICKNVRGKPAPWLNTDVKKLMNDRDKLLRKSRRTKAEMGISQYKRKRNEVNVAIRKQNRHIIKLYSRKTVRTQISAGKQLNPYIQPRQVRGHRNTPLIYKVKKQTMLLR